jgi:hypothetical protein
MIMVKLPWSSYSNFPTLSRGAAMQFIIRRDAKMIAGDVFNLVGSVYILLNGLQGLQQKDHFKAFHKKVLLKRPLNNPPRDFKREG